LTATSKPNLTATKLHTENLNSSYKETTNLHKTKPIDGNCSRATLYGNC